MHRQTMVTDPGPFSSAWRWRLWLWPRALRRPQRSASRDAHAIGVDAYIYFYPLMTMDLTRKAVHETSSPGKEFSKGPMNTFTSVPE